MSHLWIILFFLFFIISSCLSAALRAHLIPEEDRGVPNNNNGAVSLEPLFKSRRNLLSVEDPTDDTIFVTALDGTVYSVNSSSADVHWSFPSGPSIYSAYQALPSGAENTLDNDEGTTSNMNYNYLDVTDDWKLALIGPNNTVIKKYHMTMDEFLNGLPNISDHGEVTTGKKKTTVFALDAYSGRKIFEYTLDSSSDAKVEDSKKLVEYPSLDWQPIKLIYLTRKDYFLQSFWMSGQIKWNLAVAEISVSFPQGHMEDRLSSYEGDPKALSSYKGRIVHRVRVVPKAKQRDEVVSAKVELALPGPDSNLDTRDETSIPSYSNWGEITSRFTKIIGILGFATFLLYRLSRMSFVEAARRFKFLKLIKDSREKQTTASKRKKSRKLGNNKNNANFEQNSMAVVKNDGEPILEEMTKSINGGSGRKIGKLFVSNTEISKGSNGTVILEGNHEGRPVAVKRIVKAHNDAAFKEIQNLIASDHHPNIVRWYGVEYDSDFVYLSLERCTCNLNDLIQICSTSQSSLIVDDQNINSISEYNVQLNSVHGISKGIELWKTNGHPSPQLLKLMRDVVSGLAHLHELGIIHRDLKPQNVLILKERSLCVKLSDMGISKRLIGDMSSLGHHATGSGSSGWQAPEQLLHGRQTRAVDIFSLGCVLFFCITGGKHPFGDRLERDINIVKNRLDLFMVDHIPEAVDLLSQLLNFDPELRPKALEVLHHPLFWTSETRLSFLRDTSDRVELEDRETESDLLKALEKIAPVALGGKWDEKMEPTFINNIGRYRRYKFDSTRDLLRVIRNKFNHYRELPKDIQEILGPVPEGFSEYFASRFPRFLIEVYKVMYKCCKEEEFFSKYFKSSLH